VKLSKTLLNVWVTFERPESVNTLFLGEERRLIVREEADCLELSSSYTFLEWLRSRSAGDHV
jgi:hypothetical protein